MDAALFVAIVDDDASVRTALGALVQSLGYRQRSFASAAAFLQVQSEEPFSCLITDLQMPDIDGMALKGMLEARGNHVPVIMITARDDEDLHAKARASGVIALLHKPFRSRDLEHALDEALRGRNG
ncbi:response regulator transcription factor [Novosphingobium terrae]|uniref:response regulator transcription factor n=1 Tax=Novosphingobium terrae TaxID=2726189 RepID=UPI00197F6C26|nr:response regulator [Novosphingobium terrae]